MKEVRACTSLNAIFFIFKLAISGRELKEMNGKKAMNAYCL